ncbi:hypothetical protein B0H12DRAFT_1145214 [Mycena haematopus]|nr:hypothetical protein B0H12DRAFT_1145214 [Mycena haematopus]
MKFSAAISVLPMLGPSPLISLLRIIPRLTRLPRPAFEGAKAAITLVLPVPTSIPSVSSLSIPSFSLPSGVTIPSLSLPPSTPTAPSSRAPTSHVSFTAFATVSIGGVASSDGATTYLLEEIVGVNGVTTTETETIVQGATVWREDAIQETCSLDGKGVALCVIGGAGFQTSFTGSAIPVFTVAAGAGGSGGGGSASNSSGGGGSGSGSAPSGGAARVNGGAAGGWMLVGTAAAVVVAGMRLVL